jgi:hypothetical protein
MKKYLAFALLLLLPCLAFADIVVPDVDPLTELLQLITQWASLAPLIRASLGIVVVVQVFKKFVPNFKYLNIVVVLGGVLYGFLQSLASGLSLVNALTFVLLTSGGAVAIYGLLKDQLNSIFKIS